MQEAACWALCVCSSNAENQVKVARAGGIEAVMSAMRAHVGHAGVHEAGCRALLMFSGDSLVMINPFGSWMFLPQAYIRHKSESARQVIQKLTLCST